MILHVKNTETSPNQNSFSSQPVADLGSLKTRLTQKTTLLSVVNTSIAVCCSSNNKYLRPKKLFTNVNMIKHAILLSSHQMSPHRKRLGGKVLAGQVIEIEKVSITHTRLQVGSKTSKSSSVTKMTCHQTTSRMHV